MEDYPLSREMLAMSRVWQSPDRRERLIAAKGAPGAIVDLCHLGLSMPTPLHGRLPPWRELGCVLGVAQATFDAQLPEVSTTFDFEFPRPDCTGGPRAPMCPGHCRVPPRGIRVVMITGDHPSTAVSIAMAQAGLGGNGTVLTGNRTGYPGRRILRDRLADVHVFCRVQPQQKLRLVQAFRCAGEVVAMTGDGVNDAPALKAAHWRCHGRARHGCGA